MGEVTSIRTGGSISKNDISSSPGPYPVMNSGVDPLGYYSQYNTEDDPIGITSRGAGVGSITWCEGKFFRGGLNYSASIIDSTVLNTRFLYHYLLFDEKSIHNLCTFSGIPALNASNLQKLSVPIPTMALQIEIAGVLDAFQSLSENLNHGLPAEIKARRQQYEYYRDTLLTFKELKAS
jgi:type I restriction enzyme S subunit